MKILIAPDSFKESLSAKQVANAIEQGFRMHFVDAEYQQIPIADGGEGTLDALISSNQGEMKTSLVEGPLGELTKANWGIINQGQVAIIEIAEASGLALISPEKRQVLAASSYGTGQIIKQALDLGVKQIILCLGGSATNDAGAGIAQALGIQLLDKNNIELAKGGAALSRLAKINTDNLHPRANQVEWLLACDVDNPLCGPRGASAVFGPQKGASLEDVKILDMALGHFAKQVAGQTQKDHSTTKGYGAAGGAALGLSLFAAPKLEAGINIVLKTANFKQHLEGTDLVITGEGQMDYQTLHGKAPYGVAKAAKEKGIKVIGISGSLGADTSGLEEYFDAIFDSTRASMPLEQVLVEAEKNLVNLAANIASTLKLSLD